MHRRYLTKSRFQVALECPTKLYYYGKEEYANLKEADEFLLALAEGGYQVGALAKCYYPEGMDIETLDYEEAMEETNDLLKREHVTIFEAAVRFESFFIRVDILKKAGNTVGLIEVKSKSFHPDEDRFLNRSGYIQKAWKPYLSDVAFQTWVMRRK
jgi:hypothetical protein